MERRSPAVREVSDHKEGKDEMTKASIDLQDLRRRPWIRLPSHPQSTGFMAHAAFDVAGTGNEAWSRCCDTRRRKGETTGNTNIDLNRRASPRPYR